MVYSISTELCNYHQSVLEYFHHTVKKSCTYYQFLYFLTTLPDQLQPEATANLLSVSIDLFILDISFKMNQYVVLRE